MDTDFSLLTQLDPLSQAVVQMILELTGGVEHTPSSSSSSTTIAVDLL
jgi:hypothetical protein